MGANTRIYERIETMLSLVAWVPALRPSSPGSRGHKTYDSTRDGWAGVTILPNRLMPFAR